MTTTRRRAAAVGAWFCLGFLFLLSTPGSHAGQDPPPDRLTQLAAKYQTDKGRDSVGEARPGHFYTEVYDKFFSPWADEARKVCEIGIDTGASLRMWREYFPRAVIFGIDIADASRLDSDRIRTFVADQSDRPQLVRFVAAAGSGFDLVVDDGGHSMRQQQVSLGCLFPEVKPGGYYVIEDVHTSLPAYAAGHYGADRNGGNTTLTMIDGFIRRGEIKSRYMTRDETAYVASHVEFCNLFSRDRGNSITCILKKKSQ